jgi:hypothetical protein
MFYCLFKDLIPKKTRLSFCELYFNGLDTSISRLVHSPFKDLIPSKTRLSFCELYFNDLDTSISRLVKHFG